MSFVIKGSYGVEGKSEMKTVVNLCVGNNFMWGT